MRGRYSPNVVANYLLCCAQHNGAGEVIVDGARRVGWGELARRVLRLAHALRGLGVERGDKVAILCHNAPEFVEASYAAQVAGAVPAPVNFRFTAPEVRQQVRHSDARVLVYHSRWGAAAVAPVAGELGVRALLRAGEERDGGPGLGYEEAIDAAPASDPAIATELEDVAAIIYTGGTTGFPKGVMLSYNAFVDMFANLIASMLGRGGELELSEEQLARLGEVFPLRFATQVARVLRLGPVKRALAHPLTQRAAVAALRHVFTHPELARVGYGEPTRYMAPSLPFFHSGSYQMLMLGLFSGRLCYVLGTGASFDPERVLETIARERPAFLANAPAGWRRLVEHEAFERHDVSSVRVAASGTARCSLALKRRIFERFPGVIILDLFGQTEMAPLTSFRIDAGPDRLKERSVGRSMVETKIVDESGREVARGEPGEVCYRSSTLMKGYYKDEARTRASVDAEGWFRSGDLGYVDADGELNIVDRKNECINTGGEKVFPLEVEEALLALPEVEDACVFGVPDEEWGTAVRAAVKLRPGARLSGEELVARCRGSLAGYKLPKSVVFVAELPRNAIGKIRRSELQSL